MRIRKTIATALPMLLLAAIFTAVSLLPWRHLVDLAYLLRFSLFAAVLGGLAAAASLLLGHFRARRPATAALLAGLVVFGATWAWNRRGPINVVLLHLDSLRAASCSTYGYTRETTPHLDAFARERALLFERFFAQSAGTDKSTPAMLASIYPSMFYDPWSDGTNFLVPERFPLLGELLAPHGYSTYAFSSNPQVSAARNYARGFDLFEEVWHEQPRAHELMRRLEERIEALPEPFFAFGLVLDPHAPYTPLPEFDVFSEPGAPSAPEIVARVRSGEDPTGYVPAMVAYYDGEILEVDDAVGSLIDWLAQTGHLERTMLIVTSDHGEKFFEKGELGHGGTLYEEVIHVPMYWTFPSPLHFPPLRPQERRFGRLAAHVDIVPTVLGFLGFESQGAPLQGEDLVPYLFGRAAAPGPERWLLCEELVDGRAHRALRGRQWKLLADAQKDGARRSRLMRIGGGRELPAADAESASAEAAMTAELEERVARLREHYQPKQSEPAPDADTLDQLRELGYTR